MYKFKSLFFGFMIGLFIGGSFISLFWYVWLQVCEFNTIYSKDFNKINFHNHVYCGLQKEDVKKFLGEPLSKSVVAQCTFGDSCEIWRYSKQGRSSSNYVAYHVTLKDGIVWDKDSYIYLD